MPTLRFSIDARQAKAGAADFVAGATGAAAASDKADASVRKLESDMNKMGTTAKSSVAVVKSEVRGLDAELQKVASRKIDLSQMAKTSPGAFAALRSGSARLLSAGGGSGGVGEDALSSASRVLGAIRSGGSIDVSDYEKLQAVLRGVGTSLIGVDNRFGALARTMGVVRTAIAPLAASFAAGFITQQAIGANVAYEQTLKELQLVTGSTGEEFDALAKTSRDLGASTRFSASQAAQAILELSKAGLSSKQSMEAANGVLSLAIIGQMDMAESALITANVLSQFRLDASRANEVVDTMAIVANKTATDVQELALGMKFVGSAAGAMGRTVQETAAAMGVLSNNGIKGMLAGTMLRSVMSSLMDPTREATAEFKRLGINVAEINPTTNDLADVFKRLQAANMDSTSALKIFGREAFGAGLALTQGADSVRDLTQAYDENRGYAQQLAQGLDDTIQGAWYNFTSAVEELYLKLGDAGLKAALRGIIDIGAEVVRIFAGMGDEGSKFHGIAVLLSDAIVGVTVALGAMIALQAAQYVVNLTQTVGGLTGAVKLLWITISAHPIGALLTAVGLLAAATWHFRDSIITVGDESATLGDILYELYDSVKKNLLWLFNKIPEWLSTAWNFVTSTISAGYTWITETIGKLIDTIDVDWNWWGTFFIDVIKSSVNTAVGIVVGLKNSIGTIFNAIVSMGIEAFGLLKDQVDRMVTVLRIPFETDWTDSESRAKAWEDLKNATVGSIGDMQARLNAITNVGANAAVQIGQNFKDSMSKDYVPELIETGKKWTGAIAEGIRDGASDVWDAITDTNEDGMSYWDRIMEKAAARSKARAAQRAAEDAKNAAAAAAAAGAPNITGTDSTLGTAADQAERLGTEAQKARDRLTELFDALKMEQSLIGKTNDERERAEKLAEVRKLAAEAEIEDIGAVTHAYEEQLKVLQRLRALQKVNDEIKNVDRSIEVLLAPADDRDRVAQLLKMRDAMIEAGVPTDQMNQKLAEFDRHLRELDRVQELVTIADGVGRAFSDSFTDIVFGAKSAKDAFRDFVMSVIQLVFQELVAKKVASIISNIITAIGGGGGGGQAVPAQYGRAFARGGIAGDRWDVGQSVGSEGAIDYPGGRGLSAAVLPLLGGGVRTYDERGMLSGSVRVDGRIINRPTTFYDGRGLGLMGEAGPEIMGRVFNMGGRAGVGLRVGGKDFKAPIVRGRDGYLGIRELATGGLIGNGTPPMANASDGNQPESRRGRVRDMHFHISTPDVSGFNRSRRQIMREAKRSIG